LPAVNMDAREVNWLVQAVAQARAEERAEADRRVEQEGKQDFRMLKGVPLKPNEANLNVWWKFVRMCLTF